MLDVFRGALTRRMFFVFLGLAIVPTLFLLIVPAILQIQSEQEAIQHLESELEQKAEDIFTRLAKTKAQNYQQVIQPLINSNQLLALQVEDSIQASFDYDSANRAPGLEDFSDTVSNAINRVVENEPSVCNITFNSGVEEDLINNTAFSMETQLVIDPVSNNPHVLTPVDYDQGYWGILDMEICFQYLLDQVPKFGLSEESTLLLVDDSSYYIGAPSWAFDSAILKNLENAGFESEKRLFTDVISEIEFREFDAEAFMQQLESGETFVGQAELKGETEYLTGAPIEGTPFWVILLLPREGIINQAVFYGARLNVSVPAILFQTFISVVGFILVISFGALFSLRQLADPLKQLTEGANAVARGDLDKRVSEEGPGEIKVLASSFNQMVVSIKDSRQNLQEKQDELTHTLETRLREFKRINHVAELITAGENLTEKMTRTLEIIHEAFPRLSSFLYLVDDAGNLMPAARQESGSFFVDESERISLTRRMINSAGNKGVMLKEEYDSGLVTAFPVSFRDKMIGILICQWPETDRIDDSTRSFLSALTKHIAIIIENARLQNQERSLLITEERNHLARELHDSISQSLFSLSMIAEGLQVKRLECPDPESFKSALGLLVQHSKQIRVDLKEMISEMRPLTNDNQDLEEIVQSHINRLTRVSEISVNKTLEIQQETIRPIIIQNLDRILQEALSNISRHSQASTVDISLSEHQGILILNIVDDGIGFDPKEKVNSTSSFGLMNMRERVELMGGSFLLRSSKSDGTALSISIPL